MQGRAKPAALCSGIFVGDVKSARDVITFQDKGVAELKKAFQESVDDYLAFCAERGAETAKPCSAQFSSQPASHPSFTAR
jgi:predicted HicB family RNase H-like nuclease